MWLMLVLMTIVAILYFVKIRLNYWTYKGVPQPPTSKYLKENLLLILKKLNIAESTEENYNMFPNARYVGLYQFSKPVLMIRDPELLKELTVKKFDHFMDHSNIISEDLEPLWARNLFALKGQKWREMRPILSPSFTSSKMRTMFVLISECAQNFAKHFLKKNENVTEIEFKDVFSRFTNDVIATSAFGIKTDSLEDKENDFYVMGKRLTAFSAGAGTIFKFFLLVLCPKLFSVLKLPIFDKEVTSFFINLINETIKVRKEKGIVRPDMIHLLLEAQKGNEVKEEKMADSSFAAQEESNFGDNKSEQKEMTNMDIAAQALIFFFAGFETVSVLMCFMGYELAVHPEIQTRLRQEIEETLNECHGNLTYEALLKMKYMDMVVSESLRKWSANAIVDRQCTKSYTIESKHSGEKPLLLEEKSVILIPVLGIHRDPKYYPEPEKFDPERFNEKNRETINPYTYLPFGLGPRNCIGSRFALLEIKIVFFYILHHFELVPTAKSQIPLKLSTATFTLNAENGFWFGLKHLKH